MRPQLKGVQALKPFLEYLKEYFRGPYNAEYREVFICKGDPRANGFRDRDVFRVYGIDIYIPEFIKTLSDVKQFNIYMGIGFLKENVGLKQENMLYDRLAFDFDNPLSPEDAVERAKAFAIMIESKFGATPIVFETGFKGAHVVIPLSTPIPWSDYQALWRFLYSQLTLEARPLVDFNMLQWNRVDRVPLTYNVKEEGVKYCRIIYPKPFRWESFSWRDLKLLDISQVKIVEVEKINIIPPTPPKPKVDADGPRWVWRIVESGLPDGRKRFLLMVLIPMLARKGEEAVLEASHKFIENSCRNHGACGKIYDSWIMSVYRSALASNFFGFGLNTIQERDPELYGLIMKVLENER